MSVVLQKQTQKVENAHLFRTHTHLVLLRTSCTKAAGVEHRTGRLSADRPRAHAAICTYEERSASIREGILTKVTVLEKTGVCMFANQCFFWGPLGKR